MTLDRRRAIALLDSVPLPAPSRQTGGRAWKLEELLLLTDGLSVPAGTGVMMCDRARIADVRGQAIDLSFLIAGTDFVPRLRLTRDRIAKATGGGDRRDHPARGSPRRRRGIGRVRNTGETPLRHTGSRRLPWKSSHWCSEARSSC